MIAFLMALAAQAASAPTTEEQAFRDCSALVKKDAEAAVKHSSEWRMRGGGALARQCLGLAYAELGRWAPAATAFEQAARDAETAQDPRRSDFWVQSGNAWLAAGEAEKAVAAFDAALATTHLTAELRGEVHLDRGRAQVALGDVPAARKHFDKGLELVPRDPFAWYLSAALALREGNMARANSDIAKAVELAPDDAQVLLQAGTIAGTSGDIDAARRFYERAARQAPDSEAGQAARAALAADAPPATAAPKPTGDP